MGYGVQILTDTQGVDFNPYIQRLLASLKRNWEAVMPESARMGDKGMVFTSFQINKDGSVPSPDPTLEQNFRKRAARQRRDVRDPRLESVRATAFGVPRPVPPELRIVFLYNLPPDAAKSPCM